MERIKRALAALGVQVPQNIQGGTAKAVAILISVVALFGNIGLAQAVTVGQASVSLTDPRPSQVTSYSFKGGSSGETFQSVAIKCIKVTFSSSNASVITPPGFTAASATVNASSTLINASTTGWTPTQAANTFTYTNSTGVTPTTTTGATFVLDSITSSSTADTAWWYKIYTYGNTDCATTPLDSAAVQYINTNGSTVSLSVDQTLTFTVNPVAASTSCAGGTTTQASTASTIPFGTVTSASNGLVCQDLTASTNATNGYTIYIRNTGQPTNALGQSISNTAGTNATPATFEAVGTESYGYSTNDTTLGTGTTSRFTGNKYAAETTTNAELAYEPSGITTATYRIAHQVGISTTTKPGTYSTTVIYTCTPVY